MLWSIRMNNNQMLHRAHVQPCQFFSCPTSICIFRACIYFSIFAQQCTRLFIVLFANNKGEIITLHVHGCSFPTFISRREYRYTLNDRETGGSIGGIFRKNLINLLRAKNWTFYLNRYRLRYVLDTFDY